jgi:hypothetical protein
MVDPQEIDLPTTTPEVEKGSWWVFKYPRSASLAVWSA